MLYYGHNITQMRCQVFTFVIFRLFVPKLRETNKLRTGVGIQVFQNVLISSAPLRSSLTFMSSQLATQHEPVTVVTD